MQREELMQTLIQKRISLNDKHKFKVQEFNVNGIMGKKFSLQSYDYKFFLKPINKLNSSISSALNSAFLYCFANTTLPICKYQLDNQDFLAYEMLDNSFNDILKKKQIHFFNYFANTSMLKDKEFTKLKSMLKKDKELLNLIIQLNIQMAFFGMPDRNLNNIIIKDKKLFHIDIDQVEYDDNAFFGKNFTSKDSILQIAKMINNLYKNCNKEEDMKFLEQSFSYQIDKIKNIDFNYFVEVYIINCCNLNIDKQTSYCNLLSFIRRLKDKFKFNPVLESAVAQENEYLQWLINNIKETSEKINKDKFLNKILNFQGQEFFYEKFDELQDKITKTEGNIRKQQINKRKQQINKIINKILSGDNLHKRRIAFSSPKNLSDFVCDKKIR